MQAIILAAGMGKRLGHLTSHNTKCMVQVNSKTLIERMLSHLTTLDLTRIIIVIGYQGQNLREYVGESVGNIPIQYVTNPVYDKTNNIYSLYLAKHHLMEEDTLLLESDLIIEENILHRLVSDPYPNLAVVAKFESWMDGTVVSLDENDNILSFIPKKNFRHQDIPLYFKTVNIYKFSKEFSASHYVPFLDAYCKALGNNEYYEQVLRVITLLEKPDIKALRLGPEKWYEIDDVQDLDNAEIIFAEPGDKLTAYQQRGGGYWRYPELIDFSNPTNPFFPTEILKKEISTNFETLLNAHPSESGVNRLLAAKNFSINQKYVVVAGDIKELIEAHFGNENSVGILYPTSGEYFRRPLNGRLIPYYISENDFDYDADDLIAFFSDNPCKQLLIANPHNLSGSFLTVAGMTKLLDWAKAREVNVVVDESFIDFAEESETLLNNAILEKYPNLMVVRNLAASHGISGLRIAFGATANLEVIKEINTRLPVFGINSIAEFYLQIFSKYENGYIAACDEIKQERERLLKGLSGIRYLQPIPSHANYILCKIRGNMTGNEVAEKLLNVHNILAKSFEQGNGLGGKEFIQFALRSREDNNKLIDALRQVDNKL